MHIIVNIFEVPYWVNRIISFNRKDIIIFTYFFIIIYIFIFSKIIKINGKQGISYNQRILVYKQLQALNALNSIICNESDFHICDMDVAYVFVSKPFF